MRPVLRREIFKGSDSMNKQLSTEGKSRNAFLLSIAFHLIFIIVWGIIQMRMPEAADEPFIQVQFVPTHHKLPRRSLKRMPYIPPVSKVPKPQQAITTNHPILIRPTTPLVTSLVKHNFSNEKPPVMLVEKSIPLSAASDSVDESAFLPLNRQSHHGFMASSSRFSYGRQAVQRAQSLRMENQIIPPEIGSLTQSDIALVKIARHLLRSRKSDAIDIVFVVDASQSMRNDIEAVRDHISQMADLLKGEDLDVTVGIVAFRDHVGFALLGWAFQVTPQTRSISHIKKTLDGISCRGGEKALNALIQAAHEVKFRKGAERRFILVTDEYVSGSYSPKEVLEKMKHEKISVDVIGRSESFQKTLARHTGGIWLPISSLR